MTMIPVVVVAVHLGECGIPLRASETRQTAIGDRPTNQTARRATAVVVVVVPARREAAVAAGRPAFETRRLA
jgi:hypothetical protein